MDAPANGRPMGARRAAYTLHRVSVASFSARRVCIWLGTLLRNLSFVFPMPRYRARRCVGERARARARSQVSGWVRLLG